MSITAMKQALEAWQTSVYGSESHHKAMLIAMTNMSQAIEQAEKQEPHSWYSAEHDEWMTNKTRKEHEALNSYTHKVGGFDLPLYTTPQPQQAEKQEPVASDAYDKIDRFLRNNLNDIDYTEYSDALDNLYTTPPTAQRERAVFPTMLRKMWSGGEVQAWLDENVNKEKNT